MRNRKPIIATGPKICIVCEGNEEYDYLNRLKSLSVWNAQYQIKLENAHGICNIPGVYQDKYQSDTYDAVFVFCDMKKSTYMEYKQVKNKINQIHGKDNAAKAVIFFANPCSMEVILQHFKEVKLTSPNKSTNSELIKRLTGVKEYRATEQQRASITKKINVSNYLDMKGRVALLPHSEKIVGGTNFLSLIKNVENDSRKWIKGIQKDIDDD